MDGRWFLQRWSGNFKPGSGAWIVAETTFTSVLMFMLIASADKSEGIL